METFRKLILSLFLLGIATIAGLAAWEGPGLLRNFKAALSLPRFNQFQHVRGAAAILPDGRVLIAGGQAPSGPKSVEFYDPATNRFEGAPPMRQLRQFRTFAGVLPDGRVLVAGGSPDPGSDILALEAFDPKSNRWAVIGKLPEHSEVSDLAVLDDGSVLFATGEGESEGLLRFHPNTGAIDEVGHRSMVVNGSAQLIQLRNHKVLCTHLSYNSSDPNAFLFDPETGVTETLGRMAQDRQSHQATLLPDGRVLVTGGADGAPSSEIFDPATSRFTPGPEMIAPRALHCAISLKDGRVMILGGVSSHPSSFDINPDELAKLKPNEVIERLKKRPPTPSLNSEVEVFDPTTSSFRPLPPPPSPVHLQRGQRPVTLSDGRVLFFSLSGPLYFDPPTNQWSFPLNPVSKDTRAQALHN